ncbi:lytic transglycosylase domain-containing protein [Bosea sp. BIWAKO-01]|uniref:lytic transglycosylase domain-containing protein n=1 Tax=Bosea sp. BIWAKO-01 TaxID=506668 RepID=UPI000853D4BB|nr:lytic transglycosylase domain-containing protein [Bosea sp. BIWAKO-01]GAU82409.1 soluble lytic murein transglycosylase and related regulatory proteins [Bosea sp. BIWAKO-01]
MLLSAGLAGCTVTDEASMEVAQPLAYSGEQPVDPQPASDRAGIDRLIERHSARYELPADWVRRIVKRESNYRPTAQKNGHLGLMQIKHATARSMGYAGPAAGLLDPEVNLTYGIKYLRGAWLVADRDQARADRYYRNGYYYDAKRKGLLEATGLGKDRTRSSKSRHATDKAP